MSTTTTVPTVRSLAHPSTDPPTLVSRARRALGWEGSDFLVGLQGYDELMATLEVATDLEGLVRVGDPISPPIRLLRAVDCSAGLRLGRVATLPAPWRWARVGEGGGEIAGVALRQQTYSDVVGALGRAGVTFRVVPDETTTEALLETARPLGSAVLDVDEVPDEAPLVTGFLEDTGALTYGLLTRDQPDESGPVDPVDVVWLSMAAEQEAAGTLMVALERFSALGLNLDFLHSDPQGPDRHRFYVGFRSGLDLVADLQSELVQVGFSSRVLAAFGLDAGGRRERG